VFFHDFGFRFNKRLVPKFVRANFNKNGSNKPIEEHNLETMVSTLIITNVGKFIFFYGPSILILKNKLELSSLLDATQKWNSKFGI
jgi:hypothetical protein